MGRRIKRAFTILELIVALFVLSFLGGVICLKATPMLNHYRCDRSVKRLKQELRYTAYLAQVAHTDIEFCVYQNRSQGLCCERKTDEPLAPSTRVNVPFTIPHLQLAQDEIWMVTFSHFGVAIHHHPLTLIANGENIVLEMP